MKLMFTLINPVCTALAELIVNCKLESLSCKAMCSDSSGSKECGGCTGCFVFRN